MQRLPSPPRGPVLTKLSEGDLNVASEVKSQDAKITDCEYVASYNWLNRKEPTILVPGEFRPVLPSEEACLLARQCDDGSNALTQATGRPPAWTPLKDPVRLKEDSGNYFRDLNAARYPKHPSEPGVHAILAERVDFPTTSIDIFGCGSTLGHLLTFVRKVDKPFRFLVEVVGNTVFFVRKERSPTEVIDSIRGYGHTFPEAYTAWETDVEGSESHQRIIKYTFDGLTWLVRFESDGYLKHLVPEDEQKESKNPKDKDPKHDQTDSTSLAKALGVISMDRKPASSDEALTIQKGGQRIPQTAIFDLKTRAAWKRQGHDVLAEEVPRLWLRQAPNFIVAYHSYGVFDDIRTQDVRGAMDKWEQDNQDVLHRLARLVRKLIAYAKSRPDGKLELCSSEVGTLEFREQTEGEHAALPRHVQARWAGLEEPSSEGKERKDDGLAGDQSSSSEKRKEGKATANDDEPSRDEQSEEKARRSQSSSSSPGPIASAALMALQAGSEKDDDDDDQYHEAREYWGYASSSDDDDDSSAKDYTACSASDCGYCGHCRY